jgi:hypothetical protein
MSNNFASRAMAACAGSVLLLCAAGLPAQAYYTGYANGDPGNWSFYTEQQGGPCAGVRAHNGRTPVCCLKYTPEGACPDMARNALGIVPAEASAGKQ